MHHDLSVLIVAYCRYENLASILDIVENSDVSSVYISIDAPGNQNLPTLDANRLVVDIANKYSKESSKRVHVHHRNTNVGCSAAVLSSCDWFFQNEKFGIILEDDCLPSNQFFDFASEYREVLNSDENIWLISGSQFAPVEISGNSVSKSPYAFIWGWATTSEKWFEIRNLFLDNSKLRYKAVHRPTSLVESMYWYSGYRRAVNGFVDAWDTPLLYFMNRLNKKAILPPVNLISNLGDDSVAVHTRKTNPLLRLPFALYKNSNGVLSENDKLNSWIKLNIYNIGFRHVITNQITFFLDFSFKSRKKLQPLRIRFRNAEI
jgi:hypothetical protein